MATSRLRQHMGPGTSGSGTNADEFADATAEQIGSRASSLTGALTECDESKGTWPAPKTCFATSIAIAQCAGVSPPARARPARHRLACTPLSQQRECRTMLVLHRRG